MSGQALTFAQLILPNVYCKSIRSLVAMVILHFLIYYLGDICIAYVTYRPKIILFLCNVYI